MSSDDINKVKEKNVCSNCVEDYALKQFINDNCFDDPEECSYCGTIGNCVSVDDFFNEIKDGICFEYLDAESAMLPWDQEDDCYYGADTFDTSELLWDLNNHMQLSDDLLDNVQTLLGNNTWCEHELGEEIDRESRLWRQFCEIVKKRARYVFFKMPIETNLNYREDSPIEILDYIGEQAEQLELFDILPLRTKFFRGRVHESDETLKMPEELASPPYQYAKANRMSAEGISIFYGAEDEDTVLAEIYDSRFKHATIATFENLRVLTILDLTKVNQLTYPSIFDRRRRHQRKAISFLWQFCRDITRPIEKMERIEYIPAQIVAEFFRYLYVNEGERIDGIKYPSAKKKDRICYALFFDHEQCLENIKHRNSNQELCIVTTSVYTVQINTTISVSNRNNIPV